jgi:hypothetical protein
MPHMAPFVTVLYRCMGKGLPDDIQQHLLVFLYCQEVDDKGERRLPEAALNHPDCYQSKQRMLQQVKYDCTVGYD